MIMMMMMLMIMMMVVLMINYDDNDCKPNAITANSPNTKTGTPESDTSPYLYPSGFGAFSIRVIFLSTNSNSPFSL